MTDLSHLIMKQTPGVYILRDKNGVITYIGQSVNVASRILSHSKQRKFESACILQCKKEHLNDIEGILIKALCPRENTKKGTPESSLLQDIVWVGKIPTCASRIRAKKEQLVKVDETGSARSNCNKSIQKHSREPQQQPANPHRRIPAAAVRVICGDISAMTLWRWLDDEDLNFPKPIYIGRRRYWREADVIEWMEAREVAT